MNTPAPAHVAMVAELTNAIHFRMLQPFDNDLVVRVVVAHNAILDALAQPALAAPEVPVSGGTRTLMSDLLREFDRNTCTHEATHRGGAIWTICDKCSKRWADDKGGFKPYVDRPAIAAVRSFLAAQQPTPAASPAQVMQPVATTVDYLRELLAEAIATIDSLPGYPKGADLCDRIEAALEPIVEVAAPVAPIAPTTQFNDPRVQIVYDLLNSDDVPPAEQHWEGWIARRIVDALTAAKPQVLSDAQIDAATMAWFGTTDPHQAPAWRIHMRATIAAALAGGAAA